MEFDTLKTVLGKEKIKSSTLRSLKIVTEKYSFRYIVSFFFLSPAQEDASGWERRDVFGFVHDKFPGCISEAHSYYKH